MPARASHAVVTLPALDVRRRPSHRAELTSQLLMGEVVRVLASGADPQWCQVENVADGYRGWVRTWGLVPASAGRARAWQERARARVTAPVAWATIGAPHATLVTPLFLNSRVIPLRRSRGRVLIELPDGRRGWMRRTEVTSGPRGSSLMARVRSLLGSPYHWGGRTPPGYDCSAFVQQVLLEQGIALPRDCTSQFRASRALEPGEEPREGDLVFFAVPGHRPGHVGVGLGGGYFAHCRGRVVISSLEGGNPLLHKELAGQFTGWRRPRAGGGRQGRRGASVT